MDVRLEPEDSHPSGLKPIASQPLTCPNKNVQHKTDAFKDIHGSSKEPIVVPAARNGRYVVWEYDYMDRTISCPYHRCLQELLHEETTGRKFDRLVIRDIGGNHHVFYFEVTARIEEGTERLEKAFEDYQAGRPMDPHDREAIEAALKVKRLAGGRP